MKWGRGPERGEGRCAKELGPVNEALGRRTEAAQRGRGDRRPAFQEGKEVDAPDSFGQPCTGDKVLEGDGKGFLVSIWRRSGGH